MFSEADLEAAAKKLFDETVAAFAAKGKKFITATSPAGCRAARILVEAQLGGVVGVAPSEQRVKEARAIVENIRVAGEIEFLNAMNDALERTIRQIGSLGRALLGL